MNVQDLPALNAVLNGTAAVLLVTGYVLIRNGRVQAHKRVMLSAFTVSTLFLISYLTYHAFAGINYYPRAGLIHTVYLTILYTHTALAVTVPVLAIITLRRGLKGWFVKHRKIAVWTLPIWLYVSVTGVIVYLMLYQF